MSNEIEQEPFAKGIRELAEAILEHVELGDYGSGSIDETVIEAELRKRLEPLLVIAEDLAWHVETAENIRELRKELETWR